MGVKSTEQGKSASQSFEKYKKMQEQVSLPYKGQKVVNAGDNNGSYFLSSLIVVQRFGDCERKTKVAVWSGLKVDQCFISLARHPPPLVAIANGYHPTQFNNVCFENAEDFVTNNVVDLNYVVRSWRMTPICDGVKPFFANLHILSST
ncbi:hypothetical protein RIF29_04212 [Crotalaria pallida]|uniref:Uncharacterized protein n=1 Tax=Crotalaria pallida TaxID=3830 RepID=A0AAN9P9Q3_CROPI